MINLDCGGEIKEPLILGWCYFITNWSKDHVLDHWIKMYEASITVIKININFFGDLSVSKWSLF